MIDLGNAIVLECFVSYPHEETGDTLPFVPLPLTGREIIHDIGRKRAVTRREREAAKAACVAATADRPAGGSRVRLSAPCSASRIAGSTTTWLEFRIETVGHQFPGLISGSWELTYPTLTFMAECYFNSEFVLPSRAASRAARSARENRRAL